MTAVHKTKLTLLHIDVLWTALVRESIAYPCMDFQKSTDIIMDIHDFWMSVFNYPYKCGYPHWYPSNDIHVRTLCNGYALKINIYEWIYTFYGYQSSIIHAFMDILGFLWIFMYSLAMDSRSRASCLRVCKAQKMHCSVLFSPKKWMVGKMVLHPPVGRDPCPHLS